MKAISGAIVLLAGAVLFSAGLMSGNLFASLIGSLVAVMGFAARLTYCFSKRWDNHRAALGLFFAHYNFCRKHRSLKGQTPAMAHGIATEVWSVRELLQGISNT